MAPVLIYELIGWKREIFAYYQQALGDLPGIEFMPETPYGKSNRWLTVILITPEEFGVDRETVRPALEAENIEARPIWKPMHMQPVFELAADPPQRNMLRISQGRRRHTQTFSPRTPRGKNSHGLTEKLPEKRIPARILGGEVAEDLFARGLCLPSGTSMTEADLNRVIDVIGACRR